MQCITVYRFVDGCLIQALWCSLLFILFKASASSRPPLFLPATLLLFTDKPFVHSPIIMCTFSRDCFVRLHSPSLQFSLDESCGFSVVSGAYVAAAIAERYLLICHDGHSVNNLSIRQAAAGSPRQQKEPLFCSAHSTSGIHGVRFP